MSERDMKVLGYVAQRQGKPEMVCDGDSCVVAGSERKMTDYIKAFSNSPSASYQISKARYGHVMKVMKLGGAYSFDEESYPRFYSLAREDGMELVDFTPTNQDRPEGPAISLMRVQWIEKHQVRTRH
ncbi:MAG: hypothetical protein AB1512_32325 [Thermodesulfobacteriota bacterium]